MEYKAAEDDIRNRFYDREDLRFDIPSLRLMDIDNHTKKKNSINDDIGAYQMMLVALIFFFIIIFTVTCYFSVGKIRHYITREEIVTTKIYNSNYKKVFDSVLISLYIDNIIYMTFLSEPQGYSDFKKGEISVEWKASKYKVRSKFMSRIFGKSKLQYGMHKIFAKIVQKEEGLCQVGLICKTTFKEDYEENYLSKKELFNNRKYYNYYFSIIDSTIYKSFETEQIKKIYRIKNLIDKSYKEELDKLFKALEKNKLKELREIINNGIDVNISDENDKNALFIASINGNTLSLKILLENGANINSKYEDKKYYRESCKDVNVLMVSSEKGYVNVVKLLIQYGIEINHKDSRKQTALHYAIDGLTENKNSDYTETIKALISAGIELDAQDVGGETALMNACGGHYGSTYILNKRLEIIEVLAKNGANLNIKDRRGKTALMNVVECIGRETELYPITIDNCIKQFNLLKKYGAYTSLE